MKNTMIRIYLTGVGGQGTLTATTLLSRIALDEKLSVVSGEIHGMAQRGGVVESTILLGGWQSPSIYHGEADIILGFEPTETLRALSYLAPNGAVFSGVEFIPPPSVSAGKESLPSLEDIKSTVSAATNTAWYIPIQSIGIKSGSLQSGNSALLAAVCASNMLPFGVDALVAGIKKFLPPKVVEANLHAVELGIEALKKQ